MKKFIIILTAILFLLINFNEIKAQEKSKNNNLTVTSYSIGTGRTTLTQGITATTTFENSNSSLFFLYNKDLGYAEYNYSMAPWISGGVSGGIFLNVPWLGPQIHLSLFKGRILTTNWIGWTAGYPENERAYFSRPKFNFSYQEIVFVSKYFNIKYLFQNYEENKPQHVFSGDIKIPIDGKTLYFSASYVLPSEDILWGIKMKFKNNTRSKMH